MKKERAGLVFFIGFVLIIFLFTFLSLIFNPNLASIIGRLIEGKATSGSHSVSVIVSVTAPTLEIIRPLNYTYLRTDDLPLNFTSDGNDFWYNINHTSNISITGNMHFDAPVGEHVLFLYANNTLNPEAGVSTKSVVFSVNPSKIDIRYSEFNGSTKGASTDFYARYAFEELGNISLMTLENSDAGKIIFMELINLTDDKNPSDNIVDINANVNISTNRIEINSTAMPNLNKSATLYLYGLNYSNPRILRNGEVCPASICTKINYSGNTLVFNVTSFSVYSSEETPGAQLTPGSETPSGGGGGGAGITTPTVKQDLAISPEIIKIKMQPGETHKEFLRIKNIIDTPLEVTVDLGELAAFATFPTGLSTYSFRLEPKQEQMLQLIFTIDTKQKPDVYFGYITISTDTGSERRIKTIIEVEKEAMFDVKTVIPSKYSILMPSEELISEISIFNIKASGTVDVLIDYYIKDARGREIWHEHETKAIERQITFIKTTELPKNIEPGDYLFYVIVRYDDTTAAGSALFEIVKQKVSFEEQMLILLIVALIIIIAIIIYYNEKQKTLIYNLIARRVGISELRKSWGGAKPIIS